VSQVQRFTQIDAFTDRPFSGNPAAVCVLASARDAGWMQQVALEMNLAETAFLVRQPDGFDQVVHPCSRSRSLRSCYAGQRPCALGRGSAEAHGDCPVSHP
jgi:hypothetical protein